jgi:hypothetical protein
MAKAHANSETDILSKENSNMVCFTAKAPSLGLMGLFTRENSITTK